MTRYFIPAIISRGAFSEEVTYIVKGLTLGRIDPHCGMCAISYVRDAAWNRIQKPTVGAFPGYVECRRLKEGADETQVDVASSLYESLVIQVSIKDVVPLIEENLGDKVR